MAYIPTVYYELQGEPKSEATTFKGCCCLHL